MWLVALPLVGAVLVFLIGRFGRQRWWPARPLASQWSAFVVLALMWAAWFQLLLGGAGADTTWSVGGESLRLDGLGQLVILLALGLGTLVVVFSGPDLSGAESEEGYYALLLVEIGSVIGLASATDLFNLWIWFEIMAIASYVLVAFFRTERASLEAAFKYLVQSATGSLLALMGIALVLATGGHLELDVLRANPLPTPSLLACGALLLAGFGTKAGLVPFHTWLPDAYGQAPSGVSALLAGVITKLGLVALLRALAALAGVESNWGVVLMVSGALGIGLGNALAFRQRQLKRLLAWSSMAHIGYAIVGIGIGVYAAQPASAEGGLFQLLTHAIMSGAAFLAVGALLYCLEHERRASGGLTIAELAGVAGRYPIVALSFSIALLGLGGLPPLAGFMSEWQIFLTGFETGIPLICALVAFAALNATCSLAYYVPVAITMYRRGSSEAVGGNIVLPKSMATPLVTLSLASLVLGVWPGLAYGVVAPAAVAVVQAFGG